jgi:hypothetical protein
MRSEADSQGCFEWGFFGSLSLNGNRLNQIDWFETAQTSSLSGDEQNEVEVV